MTKKLAKTTWHQWSAVVASVAVTLWIARLVKGVFVSPPTPAEARAKDKDRQKQIRRGLRGLKDEAK